MPFGLRIPGPLMLVFGICLGLLYARLSSNSHSGQEVWRGGRVPSFQSGTGHTSSSARLPVAFPTLKQRKRVLDLISSLTQHYTKECTRTAQHLYVQQARDRYAPLVGHNMSPRSSWLGALGLDSSDHDERHNIKRSLNPDNHKYFFAINLYNSFDIIPDLLATLFRVGAILGYQNVFVSIYENGSSDQTPALLKVFDALMHSVGMRVVIRSSNRKRGVHAHRIEYLAEVRNSAMTPLIELRDSENEYFDSIVFMNDILPCVDDVLELIWQSRKQNAGVTCAADYMYHDEIRQPVFYDNWVARDINGTALENTPFEDVFHHPQSAYRYNHHLPVQVQSCWNGIAVLDPAPWYAAPYVRFRMARTEIQRPAGAGGPTVAVSECSASECSLLCNDYWSAGYGRIVMVPRVKLAYDNKVFEIIHPDRRNLTSIRGYTRLGGLPDDPRTDPQDRSWFGPHDRLFVEEESDELEFEPGPQQVWCWGWNGAGDLDGPDSEPVWEQMPESAARLDAVRVRHDRSFKAH
ncbi:capsular associated protein [Schizopora paradoxa]|uniref:Capsular associated protein n=1 Tax=Schizopora paradoxa TaxID=27342 RepID=A0A0H2RDS3_9AGAM|nr:capsular associated protein [Schizopora paradoxa]